MKIKKNPKSQKVFNCLGEKRTNINDNEKYAEIKSKLIKDIKREIL